VSSIARGSLNGRTTAVKILGSVDVTTCLSIWSMHATSVERTFLFIIPSDIARWYEKKYSTCDRRVLYVFQGSTSSSHTSHRTCACHTSHTTCACHASRCGLNHTGFCVHLPPIKPLDKDKYIEQVYTRWRLRRRAVRRPLPRSLRRPLRRHGNGRWTISSSCSELASSVGPMVTCIRLVALGERNTPRERAMVRRAWSGLQGAVCKELCRVAQDQNSTIRGYDDGV
jgi:hypothetical protein